MPSEPRHTSSVDLADPNTIAAIQAVIRAELVSVHDKLNDMAERMSEGSSKFKLQERTNTEFSKDITALRQVVEEQVQASKKSWMEQHPVMATAVGAGFGAVSSAAAMTLYNAFIHQAAKGG